jgi:hypothetical protein
MSLHVAYMFVCITNMFGSNMRCTTQAVGHFTSLLGHIYSVTIEHMKVTPPIVLYCIMHHYRDECLHAVSQ